MYIVAIGIEMVVGLLRTKLTGHAFKKCEDKNMIPTTVHHYHSFWLNQQAMLLLTITTFKSKKDLFLLERKTIVAKQ